jgi:hypothetical protein
MWDRIRMIDSARIIFPQKGGISACLCHPADLSAWLGKLSDEAKCFIFRLSTVTGEKNFPPST